MLKDRHRKTAEQFGILALIEKLQAELLAIDGEEDVDFDLDGFWDNIPYVIFLPKYNIVGVDYFEKRHTMLVDILRAALYNGLVRTGDRIEDYGQHFYIVTELKKEATA